MDRSATRCFENAMGATTQVLESARVLRAIARTRRLPRVLEEARSIQHATLRLRLDLIVWRYSNNSKALARAMRRELEFRARELEEP